MVSGAFPNSEVIFDLEKSVRVNSEVKHEAEILAASTFQCAGCLAPKICLISMYFLILLIIIKPHCYAN